MRLLSFIYSRRLSKQAQVLKEVADVIHVVVLGPGRDDAQPLLLAHDALEDGEVLDDGGVAAEAHDAGADAHPQHDRVGVEGAAGLAELDSALAPQQPHVEVVRAKVVVGPVPEPAAEHRAHGRGRVGAEQRRDARARVERGVPGAVLTLHRQRPALAAARVALAPVWRAEAARAREPRYAVPGAVVEVEFLGDEIPIRV